MEINGNLLQCKPGQKVWVIGDVHGCYSQFMEIISSPEIALDDIVILIGDIIDRGPDSFRMLDWAMENVNNGGKYLMIRGNHEQIIIEEYKALLEHRAKKNRLRVYIGDKPLDSEELPIHDLKCHYDFCKYMENAGIHNVGQVEKYIRWMMDLPLYMRVRLHDGKKYIVAHAWFEGELKPDGSIIQIISDDNILWQRDTDYYHNLREEDYHPMEEGEKLVHGHTPIPTIRGYYGIPAEPVFRKYSINVDGGCFLEKGYGGRLIALCLNNYKTIYNT